MTEKNTCIVKIRIWHEPSSNSHLDLFRENGSLATDACNRKLLLDFDMKVSMSNLRSSILFPLLSPDFRQANKYSGEIWRGKYLYWSFHLGGDTSFSRNLEMPRHDTSPLLRSQPSLVLLAWSFGVVTEVPKQMSGRRRSKLGVHWKVLPYLLLVLVLLSMTLKEPFLHNS